METNTDFPSGKYLPALKCLLATYAINPDHPKCHEQGCRLKLALDQLEEPLPPKVMEVIDTCYLSKFSKLKSQSLEECNEEYFESHKDSAPHIQSVVRFRSVLKPGDEDTKSKSAKDLQSTLALNSTSLEQAVEGLQLLDEIGVGRDPGVRETYLQAAQKRWPEARALQSSR